MTTLVLNGMLSECGNLFLVMGLGFAAVQSLTSFWGVYKNNSRYLALGRGAAFLQGGFVSVAFITLVLAFFICDFSVLLVFLHDHTQLPWYYRIAATWGNHEGSLLLFVLILSLIGVAQAFFLKEPFFRARTLTSQGVLIFLFLLFLFLTSNPFTNLPFPMQEGKSLNPLLQDRGLLLHPPLLYIGYVGFSASFSLAISALWGGEKDQGWATLVRPWVLLSWTALTAGITLGSWWAYYELGWGGWWFWDPVENASFMPWLAGTALLHTLRTGQLYRWNLFLSLLTFGLSLLGTFLVRSGLIISVHSFAQDPERGVYMLSLIGLIMGTAFSLWLWKTPRLPSKPLILFSRQGALLMNSLLLGFGLIIIFLGTVYPLWSDFFWGKRVSIGAPYFERTFIPLILPLFILLPLGCFYKERGEFLRSLLMPSLTVTLGMSVLILYCFYPISLLAFIGVVASIWVFGGTVMSYKRNRLTLAPTLTHMGIGLSLLGVSVGGGLRTDEVGILGYGESLNMGGVSLTLQDVKYGKDTTYLYERALLSYGDHFLTPEKRFYEPQNSLVSKTAIYTNGFKDVYVILGPYQGNHRWLIRASVIPLAPWIWIGGAFMALGGLVASVQVIAQRFRYLITRPASFLQRQEPRVVLQQIFLLFFLLPSVACANESLEKRATIFYQEVRCPVCLGQSIVDSETEEAQVLKTFILEQLRAGESEAGIKEKLRLQWGEEILFHPPFETHTLFLWLAPFGLFLLMVLGILWKIYQSRAKRET